MDAEGNRENLATTFIPGGSNAEAMAIVLWMEDSEMQSDPVSNLSTVELAGQILLDHIEDKVTEAQLAGIKVLRNNIKCLHKNHISLGNTNEKNLIEDQIEIMFTGVKNSLNLPEQLNIPKVGRQAFSTKFQENETTKSFVEHIKKMKEEENTQSCTIS
jgi:hypothetical protein